MNITMFVVGTIIFVLYIVGLLYVINNGHKEQKQDLLNDPEIPKKYKDTLID